MYALPFTKSSLCFCSRYYDEKGGLKNETVYDVPFKYETSQPPGSWALRGDRVTTLGTNLYGGFYCIIVASFSGD